MREKVGPVNPVPMSDVTTYKTSDDLKKQKRKQKRKRKRKKPELYPTRSRKGPRRPRERKTADEVLKGIFEELTKGSTLSERQFRTIGAICAAIGISRERMKDFLYLIEWIQRQPRIHSGILSIGRGNGLVYSIHEIPVLR